ncbi:MAG: hypothetical protein AAF911_07875 [Planctomycetota bacterium]
MPVYLFTLHTHGSWLPDCARGYTRRQQGILPADPHMAGRYRDKMTTDIVRFDRSAQRTLIAAVREKADIKGWTVHAVAADPTHAHILLSWQRYTPWLDVRRGLKSTITRQLNANYHPKKWLAAAGSRKRVTDRQHFDHLITTYLPSHRGEVWINPRHRS